MGAAEGVFFYYLFLEHDHMQWHFMIHSNTLFCFLSSLKAAVSCAVDLASLSERPKSLCGVGTAVIHCTYQT